MKNPLVVVTVSVVIFLVGLVGWLHDFVTLGGAGRVVYTAECMGGVWQGTTCTGHLVAGARHRFKALRNHGEVLYWTAGSPQPSGKLSDCVIQDAKDWSCKQAPAQPPAITMAMRNGRPVAAQGQALQHHCVEKWKWLLLQRGVDWFHEADT